MRILAQVQPIVLDHGEGAHSHAALELLSHHGRFVQERKDNVSVLHDQSGPAVQRRMQCQHRGVAHRQAWITETLHKGREVQLDIQSLLTVQGEKRAQCAQGHGPVLFVL